MPVLHMLAQDSNFYNLYTVSDRNQIIRIPHYICLRNPHRRFTTVRQWSGYLMQYLTDLTEPNPNPCNVVIVFGFIKLSSTAIKVSTSKSLLPAAQWKSSIILVVNRKVIISNQSPLIDRLDELSKKNWWTPVLLSGHWYPCFRLLVISMLGFKASGDCHLHAMYSSDSSCCKSCRPVDVVIGLERKIYFVLNLTAIPSQVTHHIDKEYLTEKSVGSKICVELFESGSGIFEARLVFECWNITWIRE